MAKRKVYELAKELGISSKDLITLCEQNHIEVKTHMSTLEDEQVAVLRAKAGAPKSGSEKPKEETAKQASKQGEASGTAAKPEEKEKPGPAAKPEAKEKPGAAAKPEEKEKPGPAAKPEEKEKPEPAAKPEAKEKSEPAARPEAKSAPAERAASGAEGASEERPRQKKKKNIIFVSNPYNSKMQGQGNRNFGGSDRRPGNAGGARPVNRPIRPLTPPSPTPSVNIIADPNKGQNTRRPASRTEESHTETNRQPETVNDVRNTASVNTSGAGNTGAAGAAASAAETADTRGREKKPAQDFGRGYQNGARPSQSGARPRGQGGYGRDGARPDAGRGEGGRGDGFRGDGFRGQTRQGGQGYGANGQRPAYRQDGSRNADGGGRGGYNRAASGRPGGFGGQGGQRSYGNSERFERGDGGKDARFGRKSQGGSSSYAPEASIKDQEKHRDEEKRRIEKDKKNKKELIYEKEQENVKGRKAGRFIKPEKKKEEQEEQIKVITLPENLTIKELADKMKVQPSVIVKKLFLQGKVVTVNQEISYEQAEEIAIDYDIICEKEVKVDVIAELLKEGEENAEDMVKRPPVICVMGHVDHGKTSLLDAIRKTNVTDKEAGGITQAIGAYTVTINDEKITFLDTPGHEAFTAMRMRGANSTDIAVLVVAADDGVMPQTVEAINHAKAAGIEIIVAVNKIDKPNANIDRVKQELTEYELIPVDWGGSTEFVPVSAKTGAGISDLLETILLTADILELKANPNRRARGLVIEAELDKGRGPVATVLVQKGTLHVGDYISAGASSGKVRAMIDDKGRRVREAKPSTPVEILGLNDVPNAGEIFIAHDNDKEAKSFADTFVAQNKVKLLEETKAKMSLDDLFSQIQAGNLKELNIIIKADVQGSVEAVKQSLLKLSNEEVVVKVIHGGVGAINESDVSLASASSAIIIGFNVRPDAQAKATAEREGVDVRLYKVIYQAIEDVEAAMKGMLDPVYEEKVIGHAEVRQIFRASAIGNIAGSYVVDGCFQRGCKIRISREGEQIYEGSLASLKRFKDDVKEVKEGFECGLVFEGFDQMKELDMVEAYIMVEVPR